MVYDAEYRYLHIAIYALLGVVLGAAIFFWGRGIRKARTSDLIAGPAILVALCVILFAINGDLAFGFIGNLLIVFGLATLLLSALAPRGGPFPRRMVITIGLVAIVVGLCLSVIL